MSGRISTIWIKRVYSIALAIKQLEGQKKDNERITIIVYCNGNGSDKLPLWIIGKYATPKYFENVNINNLIVIIELTRKYGWFDYFLKNLFVGLIREQMAEKFYFIAQLVSPSKGY